MGTGRAAPNQARTLTFPITDGTAAASDGGGKETTMYVKVKQRSCSVWDVPALPGGSRPPVLESDSLHSGGGVMMERRCLSHLAPAAVGGPSAQHGLTA